MHWHLLLQSKFVDAQKLSIRWGELVEQEYAVVKVIPVKEKTYLQEICKYVVEGSELAKWEPQQILEFVESLQGTRCFTVFGEFTERRKKAAAQIESERVPTPCECGCCTLIAGDSVDMCNRIFSGQFRK